MLARDSKSIQKLAEALKNL